MTNDSTTKTKAGDPSEGGSLLLSQPQAAAFIGVSRSVWFRLRAENKLPAPVSPTGGDLKWRRRDLERFVEGLKAVKRPRRVAVPKSA